MTKTVMMGSVGAVKKRVGFAFLGWFVLSSSLTLQSWASTGQSSQDLAKKWYHDLRLGVFGWSYGPSFAQFTTARSSTPTGDLGSPVTIGTQFNLSAPVSGEFRATVVEALVWNPWDDSPLASMLTASDPAVGIAGSHIATPEWSWWARYEVAPAITAASLGGGQRFTFRAITSLGYSFGPKLRWKLRSVLVPAWTSFGENSANSLYWMPNLNYTFSDRWSLGIFVETAYSKARGDSVLEWTKAMEPNLAIGPTISISTYWIQPFLNIYPGGKINTETAHLGVYFGGRIL